MYFRYGNYTHPSNTVDMTSIQAQRMYSPRNRLAFTRWTLTCQGHFCVSGQSDIKDQLAEFEAAYADDWKDVGLYHDDGSKSAHYLTNRTSINGVRVANVVYPSKEAEYASGRSFAMTFQADYLNIEDQIYEFEETVQMVGSSGPSWSLELNYRGPPRIVVNHSHTVQKIVQQGKAVGLEAPPALPAPLLSENYEHMDQRMVVRQSARKIGRHANLLFPLQYRYVYSSVDSHFTSLYPWPDYPGR